MRGKWLAGITGLLLVLSAASYAQLVGTDTLPGDSCVGVAEGATRMNADADLNGASVVLVCDGSVWQTMAGGGAAAPDRGIQFNSGSALAASPDFILTPEGHLGIGAPYPWARLHVGGDDEDTTLVISNNSSTADRWPGVMVRNYSGATDGHSALALFRARGSADTPEAVSAWDTLGALNFMGLPSAGDPWSWGIGASVGAHATENWDETSMATNLEFSTTPSGNTSPVTRMTITHTGRVGIGTQDPASALHVNGGIAVGHDAAACSAYKDGTLRYTTGVGACPSGGVEVGGSCWYFGSTNQSCDTVCGNVSLAYDSATLGYAGSGGNNTQCGAILDAVGAPGSGDATSGSCTGANTIGCAWRTSSGGARRRCANSATSSSASNASYQRACACGTGPVASAPLWEYCDGGAEAWRPFEHAAVGGGCTPSVNNVQYMATTNQNTTYTLSSYAVPDLDNRILVVSTHHEDWEYPVTNVTFGGSPLTKISEVLDYDGGTSLWYMVNPPATTANIVVTYDDAPEWSSAITARTLDCVAQQAPEAVVSGGFDLEEDEDGDRDITTLTDNAIVVDTLTASDRSPVPAITQGPGQVNDWSHGWAPDNGTGAGISHRIVPTAGVATMGWSIEEEGWGLHVMAAFAPAASGPMPPDCEDDSTGQCVLQAARADGDPQFTAANIASGVNILGITGTMTGGGGTAMGGSCFATWVERDSDRDWRDIAVSEDGMKMVGVVHGGRPYTSTDGGQSWVQRDSSNRNWVGVASSTNGDNLVGVVENGRIYTSTNGGANWTQRDSTNRNWSSVTSSADGTRLAATVSGGRIFTSTNSGANWTSQAGSPTADWTSIASSADGTKLVALNETLGRVHISTDSGETWSMALDVRNDIYDEAVLTDVAISANGNVIAVAAGNVWTAGMIIVSTDGGTTWDLRPEIVGGFYGVSVSYDGTKIAAARGHDTNDYGGRLFVSSDSGASWSSTGSSMNWGRIAMSGDGNKTAVFVWDGKIHTSESTCPVACSDNTASQCLLQADRGDGDPEFLAANIASGVNILGVTGTLTGTGGGTCAAPGDCLNVGDVCADGSLFAGFVADPAGGSCRIIYVTDSDQSSTSTQWKNAIGTNDISTDDHVDGQVNHANRGGALSDFPAFDLCEANSYHGKSGWYLPARAELNLLWLNRAAINANAAGSFASNDFWSSTEHNMGGAWYQDFGAAGGGQYHALKTDSDFAVRCIRSVNGVANIGGGGSCAPAGCSNIGDVCTDGTVFAGCHPTLFEPLFTTRCDGGRTWNGSACTGTRADHYWVDSNSSSNIRDTGVISQVDGKENTLALTEAPGGGACLANQPCDSRTTAGVQAHNAAQFCAGLDMHGHQDWYLPASLELYIMSSRYVDIGDFYDDVYSPEPYWASTDHNAYGRAYWSTLPTGDVYNYGDKQYGLFIRCMRRGGS